jgi:transaldolase/glucose-6-phosphate isomerase
MKNSLQSLHVHGQSVWLDYLRRSLITSGELKRLIGQDGVRGLTSNPSIFAQAIAGTSEYRYMLEAPESQGLDAKALYERIAVRDIQDAADLFRPVYLESKRRDGYVSLEVSPRLAHDTKGTLEEARRLWRTVNRENLMIKVPATLEGISAFRQLIGEGLNVNVTLLFAQEIYEQVVEAYLDGLESLAKQGGDLSKVASVASFFISRIDTAVDNWIAGRLKEPLAPAEQDRLRSLLGKVAVASAKTTYQKYLELFRGDRWEALIRHGAQTQRLLWASTGTKNPAYSDVLYVEELIGPDTVNTVPPATLDAFRDHGRARSTLTENIGGAITIMEFADQADIPLQELTDKLLADGVTQFADAFDKLLTATNRNGREPDRDPIDQLELKLMKDLYEGRKRS